MCLCSNIFFTKYILCERRGKELERVAYSMLSWGFHEVTVTPPSSPSNFLLDMAWSMFYIRAHLSHENFASNLSSWPCSQMHQKSWHYFHDKQIKRIFKMTDAGIFMSIINTCIDGILTTSGHANDSDWPNDATLRAEILKIRRYLRISKTFISI